MEARKGMWFVWDHEDRLRPSWIVDSRNSECPKCQVSNSLICFDKSSSFFFFKLLFQWLGIRSHGFSCNALNFCPFHTEWKHQQHCTYWFFARMYGTCYWTFGNCYNSQIETDASCGAVCVCVCVEVLEATHWALLGSETQESVLEWAVPEKESTWLTGRKAWMALPCPTSAVPRVRSIIRPSADSPHCPCSVSWRHVVCKWTCVLVFEPHVTEQSCMPILNPLLWEGRTFSGVETALSLMTNIC